MRVLVDIGMQLLFVRIHYQLFWKIALPQKLICKIMIENILIIMCIAPQNHRDLIFFTKLQDLQIILSRSVWYSFAA